MNFTTIMVMMMMIMMLSRRCLAREESNDDETERVWKSPCFRSLYPQRSQTYLARVCNIDKITRYSPEARLIRYRCPPTFTLIPITVCLEKCKPNNRDNDLTGICLRLRALFLLTKTYAVGPLGCLSRHISSRTAREKRAYMGEINSVHM